MTTMFTGENKQQKFALIENKTGRRFNVKAESLDEAKQKLRKYIREEKHSIHPDLLKIIQKHGGIQDSDFDLSSLTGFDSIGGMVSSPVFGFWEDSPLSGAEDFLHAGILEVYPNLKPILMNDGAYMIVNATDLSKKNRDRSGDYYQKHYSYQTPEKWDEDVVDNSGIVKTVQQSRPRDSSDIRNRY
jgi:hypothetical protein